MSEKKKTGNRYSGEDPEGWIVKTASGRVGKESYTGFKAANFAARKHTQATGEFAQAVRR